MKKSEAKRIGSKLAVKSILIGLLIAQCIMTLFASDSGVIKAIFWFTDFDYLFNIIFAVIVSITVSHFFGKLTGFAILIVSSFISSWVGFFQEGIDNVGTHDDPFYDYIFKPVYAVTFFGFLPVLIVGSWYGRQIKKHAKEGNPADNT